MALSGNDLAQEIYNSLDLSGLDDSEKAIVLSGLQDKWTIVINYFKDNGVIQPGTFAAGGDPVTGTGSLT